MRMPSWWVRVSIFGIALPLLNFMYWYNYGVHERTIIAEGGGDWTSGRDGGTKNKDEFLSGFIRTYFRPDVDNNGIDSSSITALPAAPSKPTKDCVWTSNNSIARKRKVPADINHMQHASPVFSFDELKATCAEYIRDHRIKSLSSEPRAIDAHRLSRGSLVSPSDCAKNLSIEGANRFAESMFMIKSSNFQKFKQNHLLHVSSNAPTIVIPSAGNTYFTPNTSMRHRDNVWEELDPNICESIINPTASQRKDCIALVFADAVSSLPQAPPRVRMELIGVESKIKLKPLDVTNAYPTTGLYGHAGAYGNGRAVVRTQLGNLFEHLHDMERIILAKLKASHSNLKPGDDVILIVLNDGEIDIFINFACSMRAHGLEASYLHKVVVFAGSDELADMVDATGAIGVYHHSFYQVNRGASYQYLDKTFTDMMWYKSFSLYMMLRLKFNVLFQDADLVWFKEPFSYFRHHSSSESYRDTKPLLFLSDDGQRTMRYTPFYANSGFYYMPYHNATEHFAYNVMKAFDVLFASGSHQNVFTTKLMELLDMHGVFSYMLPLHLFPTGIVYHHYPKFMAKLRVNNLSTAPYHFHMCWTANKREKIKYFKETGFWYVDDKCYIQTLWPGGAKQDRHSVYHKIMKEHWNRASKADPSGISHSKGKPTNTSILRGYSSVAALDLCCAPHSSGYHVVADNPNVHPAVAGDVDKYRAE